MARVDASILVIATVSAVSLQGVAPSYAQTPEPCPVGREALFDAVQKGDQPAARKLLAEGEDPNKTCRVNPYRFQQETPVTLAIGNRDLPMIELLLRHRATVDRESVSRGALHRESRLHKRTVGDRTDIALALIKGGADVNLSLSPIGMPLHAAAIGGRVETARVLLDAGADLNGRYNERTPLMVAARAEQLDVSKFLLSRGAEITEQDFHLGIREGSLLLVHFFLARGGDPNMRLDRLGNRPLHVAARKLWGTFGECAELLVLRGANVNARNDADATPLHAALAGEFHPYSGTWFVELLLASGADPGARDGLGRTPADVARARGLTALAEILAPGKRSPASGSVPSRGSSPGISESPKAGTDRGR